MRTSTLLLVVLLAAPRAAAAGRTHFGWLYDVEVNPQRAVELESWVLEENGKGDTNIEETLLWWAPVVGVTDEIEIAVPVTEMTWVRSDEMPDAKTTIATVGVDAKWRMVTSDPEDAPPLVPLVRGGVKRLIGERDAVRLEVDAVLAYDIDRVHLLVDVGSVAVLRPGDDTVEVRPGAGVSVRVVDELRVGAEAYGEIGLVDDTVVDWYAIGPVVSWTHGRFWLAASLPIGVYGIDTAPRLNSAIAF